MNHIKLLYLSLLACMTCLPLQAAERTFALKSPDGNLEVEIKAGDRLSYSLKHKNKLLLAESPIGLVLEDKTLGTDVRVSGAKRRDGGYIQNPAARSHKGYRDIGNRSQRPQI